MDFAHPHFAEPRWLWLALLGPTVTGLLFIYGSWARRRQIARFLSEEYGQQTSSHSPGRRRVKQLMLVMAVAGMGLGLARPQWGEQTEMAHALGDDLLFLLDCSRSMLAADVRPSRLSRAKLAIIDFVEQHGRGRVGLVAFAGQAFLQCPLTYDYDAFRESLLSVDGNTIPVPGTDVGRALDEGFLAMEKNDRRKVMVILTDGEDLEKAGVSTARKLAGERVSVFAVGIGTVAGSPIVVAGLQGTTEYLRDARGNVVQSRLDEDTLRAMAEASGGRYQALGPLGEGMRRVLHDVDSASDLRNARPQRKLGVDRFHLPVALVLMLLVMESLIGTRRKSSAHVSEPPRRAVSLLTSRAPLWLLGFLFLGAAHSERGQAQESAGYASASARVLYSQGAQYLREGKWEEAELALLASIARQDERIQPLALYNLGHVRFQQGRGALKKGPEFQAVQSHAQTVSDLGQRMLKDADAALAAQRIEAIVSAYRQARPARRQLKQVSEEVRTALELYRTALLRWDRASGDFKSARELAPGEDDARFNAEVVDLRIARLVEETRRMQQSMQSLAGLRQQLQQRMNAMKKYLPKEEQEDGEEEDEEEQNDQPREGQQEKLPREGREKFMTREEAARMLESLKLDTNRKLPMGFERTNNVSDRPGRTW